MGATSYGTPTIFGPEILFGASHFARRAGSTDAFLVGSSNFRRVERLRVALDL